MKFINKFYLLLLLMNFTVYIHREQECPKYEIKNMIVLRVINCYGTQTMQRRERKKHEKI